MSSWFSSWRQPSNDKTPDSPTDESFENLETEDQTAEGEDSARSEVTKDEVKVTSRSGDVEGEVKVTPGSEELKGQGQDDDKTAAVGEGGDDAKTNSLSEKTNADEGKANCVQEPSQDEHSQATDDLGEEMSRS